MPNTTHTFPRFKDGGSPYNVMPFQCSVISNELGSNSGSCDSSSISSLSVTHNDNTFQRPPSDKISLSTKGKSTEKFSHAVIRRSLSVGALNDYPGDSSVTDSRGKIKLFRQYCSLGNINTLINDDGDDEEEDYVIPSLYSIDTSEEDYVIPSLDLSDTSTDVDDYLEFLPSLDMLEHIRNCHGYGN